MRDTQSDGIFRKAVPASVIETKGLGADGGIIRLKNGALLLAQGGDCSWSGPQVIARWSHDDGRTWESPMPFPTPIGVGGMIRLQSGALAIYGKTLGTDAKPWDYFTSQSMDEGRSWTDPSLICDYPNFTPLFHSMIQLSSGRLLFAGYWEGFDAWEAVDGGAGGVLSVHPECQYADVCAYGTWHGQRYPVEGHAHAPEMGMTLVYRSDDEGATWQKHPGGLMGWFDFEGVVNGYCGQIGCYEPTLAETRDGHVLLLMRSPVGRLVQSISTDGGEHWTTVKPSDLPSSESPGVLVTLPETRDLLLIWNQVSREEIRRGFRRGRLSSAISRNGGHCWERFKTLELSEGLEDLERIPPQYPLQMVRARNDVGPLPDGFAFFHYPNVDIVGDHVILRYSRGTPLLGVAEQNLHRDETVLRVYPLEWFYA